MRFVNFSGHPSFLKIVQKASLFTVYEIFMLFETLFLDLTYSEAHGKFVCGAVHLGANSGAVHLGGSGWIAARHVKEYETEYFWRNFDFANFALLLTNFSL